MTLEEVTTLKEAIKRLKEVIKEVRSTIQPFLYDNEAKDYILKALEQESVLDKIRAELKTKYDSIPWRNNDYDDGWVEALEWVLDIIDKAESEDAVSRQALPSVNPQKTGHWKEHRNRATGHIETVCSECGAEEGYPYNDYCGNCGAKMVELKESAEPHECNTCKFGSYYKNGYDVTTMDDECGGCCSWNDKWQSKAESEE